MLRSLRSGRRQVFLIALALILTLPTTIFVFVFSPKPAHAASFSWTINSDGNSSPTTTQTALNQTDIPPAYFKEGSTIYMVVTDGGNALNYNNITKSGSKDIHVYSGSSMDTLSLLSDDTLYGNSTFSTADGAHPWFTGGWVDTSTVPATWYATVHIEFGYTQFTNFGPTQYTPNFGHFRKIGIATSTNHGSSWTYLGDAITSNQSSVATDYAGLRYFNYGDGDQRLFVDSSYFYLYYTTAWIDQSTGQRFETTRAARCPLSSKMAPSCWSKWYDGSWTQSGLGGKDSDIFIGQDNAVVTYNTALSKYVAIGHGFDGNFIATATDLSQQDWTPLEHFSSSDTFSWYNWAYDPTNLDPYTMSSSFRIYSSCNTACGAIAPSTSSAATKYMSVTFSSTGSSSYGAVSVTPPFPYQSVPDFNPGWQRDPVFNTRIANTEQYDDFQATGSRMSTILSQGATATLTDEKTYMQGQTATQSSPYARGELWVTDSRFSSVADGELDFNVNPVSGQKFAIIFRETSTADNNYAMLVYDTGQFSIKHTWGDGPNVNLFSYTLPSNVWDTMSLAFRGQFIEVGINGQEQYSGYLPSGTIPTTAGNIGYRVFDNATTNFDNFVTWTASSNLVRNPGFESDPNIPDQWETTPSFDAYSSGHTTVAANNYAVDICFTETNPSSQHICNDSSQAHSGYAAARLNSTGSQQSVEQVIAVKPRTTYTVTGYLKVSNTSDPIYLGVKQYGGAEKNVSITTTTYTQATVQFTTGQNASSARIYLWKPSGSDYGYADDISLTETTTNEILSGATTLSGSYSPVNLTTVGTSDWILWGSNSNTATVVRKSTGGSQLSTFSASGSVSQSGGGGFTMQWTDGNSPTSGSDNHGVYMSGANNTFTFTAPADTTPRLLHVYAYTWGAQLQMTGHLSDDSSNVFDYTNSDLSSATGVNSDAVYSLWYQAASASQTLTVTLKLIGGSGGIILHGAALQAAPASGGAILSASYTSASPGTSLNLTGNTDWVYWGISSGSDGTRRNLADTNTSKKIGEWTNLGAGGYNLSGGGGFSTSWTDGISPTSATNTSKGSFVGGAIQNGFSWIVPVDSTTRTIKVYVYTWQSQGRLQVRYTDGSDVTFQGYDISSGAGANGDGY